MLQELLQPGRLNCRFDERIADFLLIPSKKLLLEYKFCEKEGKVRVYPNLKRTTGKLVKDHLKASNFVKGVLLSTLLAVKYAALIIFNPFLLGIGLGVKSISLKLNKNAKQFHIIVNHFIDYEKLKCKRALLDKQGRKALYAPSSIHIDNGVKVPHYKISQFNFIQQKEAELQVIEDKIKEWNKNWDALDAIFEENQRIKFKISTVIGISDLEREKVILLNEPLIAKPIVFSKLVDENAKKIAWNNYLNDFDKDPALREEYEKKLQKLIEVEKKLQILREK